MDTRPQLYRVDTLAEEAVGVKDPCAVLLENGPGFSVLVARRFEYSERTSRLQFKNAFQLKIDAAHREMIHDYAQVEIYQHAYGAWVAGLPNSDRIFGTPSLKPYRVVFLPWEDYEDLRDRRTPNRVDRLFSYCRDAFGQLPGFYSPNARTLITPDDYACAAERFPAGTAFI